jgi:hypothetical protein
MKRERVLADAARLVTTERAVEYGDAHQMHSRVAAIWAAILGHKVSPHQVALCMAGLKLARLSHSPRHRDSWVDAAAYVALGAEIASGDR